jgi:hypothetical protein
MTLMLGEAAGFAAALFDNPPYNVAAEGMPPVWVADIDDRTASLVHVEWIADPASSPLVQGSSAPQTVRRAVIVDLLAVFGRYREVLDSEANPLSTVRIITNSSEAVPLLSWLHNEVGCVGVVEVATVDG